MSATHLYFVDPLVPDSERFHYDYTQPLDCDDPSPAWRPQCREDEDIVRMARMED